MYFTGGYAIHGNPSVPPYPASHGCVRVPMWVAPRLYATDSVRRDGLRVLASPASVVLLVAGCGARRTPFAYDGPHTEGGTSSSSHADHASTHCRRPQPSCSRRIERNNPGRKIHVPRDRLRTAGGLPRCGRPAVEHGLRAARRARRGHGRPTLVVIRERTPSLGDPVRPASRIRSACSRSAQRQTRQLKWLGRP